MFTSGDTNLSNRPDDVQNYGSNDKTVAFSWIQIFTNYFKKELNKEFLIQYDDAEFIECSVF